MLNVVHTSSDYIRATADECFSLKYWTANKVPNLLILISIIRLFDYE